jgi:hypothetical protein
MVKPVQNQFNGGELSPYMDGRFDLPVYSYSAEVMLNNIPISEGCIKRRGGSHFVSSVKQIDGFIFGIKPTPEDATVIINGVEQTFCYCGYMDEVEYTVKAEGYVSKSGRVTVSENTLIPISLSSTSEFFTFTINPDPADAKVMINGVQTNSITREKGAPIRWSVSKEGLITQNHAFNIYNDVEMDIKLMVGFTLIPDPIDSEVIINGEKTNSVILEPGSTVEWSVSHPQFPGREGTEVVNATVNRVESIVSYENESVLFESGTGGSYSFYLYKDVKAEVTVIGAGGAAAIRGVYDDKGYGWGGGSGGGFKGVFDLRAGQYNIEVGKANNNTAGQGGNTNTINPANTAKYGSKVDGIVEVGGGGSANSNVGVGVGGSNATLHIVPLSIEMNVTGNAGSYGYGGKGSSWPPAHCEGGVSVYEGYGKGQGCVTSEYAGARYWKNGTDGYVKIVIVEV